MRTLITIMAHKDAQATFNLHFDRHWKRICGKEDEILVAFPSDAKIEVPNGCQRIEVGLAAHTGPQSIVRLKTIMERMAGSGFDRYLFFEYDSICLGPMPDWYLDYDIYCPLFRDNGPNRGFKGETFCHPPILMTQHGIDSVLKVMMRMPNTEEGSVWDRFFGYALEQSGAKAKDLLSSGEAFSHNTIHPSYYEGMEYAIRHGAIFLHGIKDAETLRRAERARELREKHLDIVNAGLHSPEDFEPIKPN